MKKSNKKKRRRLVALLIFLSLCLLILWLCFRKKDYTIEYKIEDYEIKETFYKEKDYYSFEIKKGEKEYHTILSNSHFLSKKLIYKVETLETKTESCIKIHSNKLRFTPLCKKNETEITYHLVSEEMKKKLNEPSKDLINTKESYNQIEINTLLYNDYYIWNYRGFYHLKEGIKETIHLFDKDIYEPKLLAKVGDYLFIPDYNSNYYFEKVTLLNRKNGNQEIWNLEEPIYFDSVLLGEKEDSLYLVDKHEKIEWKLDPKKKKMEKIGTESKGGVTYDQEFSNISMTKLINGEGIFKGVFPIEYKIENGLWKVLKENEILVREKSPEKIITTLENGVFYLEKENLYSYQEEYGEVKIMSYFEWNFNNDNVIFIF